ncbi:MAG: transcriptional repressor [Deltaproteobacteria bacterium]|nr:transcriptional repressor [Deltaproteobacteria bacterium]
MTPSPDSSTDSRFEAMQQALRQRGLRLTPQRLAVLKILAESQGHPSVEAIHREVTRDFPTTSLATIYKTVTLLKELGQVLELGFADWGSRYDGKRPYPHPHVICTQCGAIVDPEFSGMQTMAAEMGKKSGYQIKHHRLDFFGLCPACQKAE